MKKTKPHKHIWNKILKNPLWYLFGMFVLLKGGYETYNNYRLKNEGICTSAVITGNAKRGHRFYRFRVNGVTYQGKGWTDKTIGDTLTVVFLPSNPKINRYNQMTSKYN